MSRAPLDLATIKLLITEAIVEEMTSQPDFNSTATDKVSDLFMEKLTTLHGLGLSRFWSSERLSYYSDTGSSGISLCSAQVFPMVLSFHARFMVKLDVAIGGNARGYMEELIRSVIKASTLHATGVETLQYSLLTRESFYFFSADERLGHASPDGKMEKFISANLWLGSIYLALATGAMSEITNVTLKGK